MVFVLMYAVFHTYLGICKSTGITERIHTEWLRCPNEFNFIRVAARMALEERIPVVYSIAPFATMRTFEQIRNNVCYQNLNVKIVGVGAGFSYGMYGHTHHGLEDMEILRTSRQARAVVTLKEHSVIGGLGSVIAEVRAESGASVPFKRIGVPDRFTQLSGQSEYMRTANGLDIDSNSRTISALLR